MALRSFGGFRRYAVAVQYHGAYFLGFSKQGDREGCILPDGTDLRGYFSVQGKLEDALGQFVGQGNFQNLVVSSRTDRGVHAIRNTFHVDVRPRKRSDCVWDAGRIHRGWNFHLSHNGSGRKRRRSYVQPRSIGDLTLVDFSGIPKLRILSVQDAPQFMYNKFAHEDKMPQKIDWNARFSATQRTYMYRILCLYEGERDFGVPFEWDTSWRVVNRQLLDIEAMRKASLNLIGTHDFTSFRGAGCQRMSPIVSLQEIEIFTQPCGAGSMLYTNNSDTVNAHLITIKLVGESFLYRQVRNLVGCLVHVGLNKLTPEDVKVLLEQRDRSKAPQMAPAHGLFLVNVEHGSFEMK